MATAERTALVERPSKITDLATPMAPVGGPMTVMPRTFGELVQFADLMSRCNFVPQHLRQQPGDCMAVVMQAMRWDADPFMVAQKTYFVRPGAAPGYEAQLIAAIISARAPIIGRPDIEWSGDWPKRRCKVSATFRGETRPKVREVTAETITTRNSPLWKSDPDQQLAYYTLRSWARLYCPDIIMGIYTPDEVSAIRPEATDIQAAPSKLDAALAQPDPRADGAADVGDTPVFEEGTGGEPKTPPGASEPAVITLPHPGADATVKAWTTWRAQIVDAIAAAPSLTWLAEFQHAHDAGFTILATDFPPQAKMVRDAIAARVAALNGAAAPPAA